MTAVRNCDELLDAVSVSDGLDVMRVGRGRRGVGRAHALDDAAEVAVADRLAVFAERDDRAVDLRRSRRAVSVKPSASQRDWTA